MSAAKKRRGRPRKSSADTKSESILLRMELREKQAFQNAANVAGVPLSIWIRERLRCVAKQELEAANLPIPFLQQA